MYEMDGMLRVGHVWASGLCEVLERRGKSDILFHTVSGKSEVSVWKRRGGEQHVLQPFNPPFSRWGKLAWRSVPPSAQGSQAAMKKTEEKAVTRLAGFIHYVLFLFFQVLLRFSIWSQLHFT